MKIKAPVLLGIAFLGIWAAFYFGFDVSSVDHKRANEIRKQDLLITGIENIKMAADARLQEPQKAELKELMLSLQNSKSTPEKIESLKRISGFWFRSGEYELAGSSAEDIAKEQGTAEAWNDAGMNYFEGLNKLEDEKRRIFCFQSAEKAFQNAHSLDSKNPEHQLYQALCYVKVPGNEPMKGILMLRDLESKFPDYLPIQLNLVRLAIQTNQWDRAKSRLETILEKEKSNAEANCLMVEVLSQTNQLEKIEEFKKFCK